MENMNSSTQSTIKAKPSDIQAQALSVNIPLQWTVEKRLIKRNIKET